MANKNQQDGNQVITDWLPGFYKLAAGYWRKFPASVRSFYTIDDMVQDMVLCVTAALPNYDAARGASLGTYAYCVAANSCLNLLTYYNAQKRCPGVSVPIEDWVCTQHSVDVSAEDLVATQDLVDRIISLAPEGVVCALADPAWVVRSPKRLAEYAAKLGQLAQWLGTDHRTFARAIAKLAL